MQDRPLTLPISQNYQLCWFSFFCTWNTTVLADRWSCSRWSLKGNYRWSKSSVYYLVDMSQHLNQDLFTDTGLIYIPFPPKGHTKVWLRRELCILVKIFSFSTSARASSKKSNSVRTMWIPNLVVDKSHLDLGYTMVILYRTFPCEGTLALK